MSKQNNTDKTGRRSGMNQNQGQGEGSGTENQRYNEGAPKFIKSGKVGQDARESKEAMSDDQTQEPRPTEQKGSEHPDDPDTSLTKE